MKNLLFFLLFIFLLFIGRSLFTPLIMAVFLWYLTNSISAYYRKAIPAQKSNFISKIFDGTAFTLAIITMIGFVLLFIWNIQPMISELVARLPALQAQLSNLLHYLAQNYGITIGANTVPNLMQTMTNIGGMAANAAVTFGMVIVYMIFMFLEQGTFQKKLSAMFPAAREYKKISFILKSIDTSMKRYFFVKTAVSAITALVSYFWLKYIGLEFASVWAFIIFITSYIPTFGAIIACALPITYALLVAPTLALPLLTGIGLIALQIVFGNIIEPKLTGRTLNISTLAILINLVFWGMIWGPIGMFFSVPLLVATIVITAQFDETRKIAILLSENGTIPEKED